jgi:ATP-dependent DNA helicase RecG
LRGVGQHHGHSDQDVMEQIIAFCKEPKSANEIMQKFHLERSYFRRHYLDKMLEIGVLNRTEPDKPKSGKQKYFS